MIRGSFRGFISGWPGVVLLCIALLAIVTCFCCWCASIFYGRSKTRKRDSGANHTGQDAQEMVPMDLAGPWAPPTEPPVTGPCPYPTDPSLDGMPRPCV